ncbi:MAG: EutN/CcmL family microcompartment protein [Planctomycetia bacterium]|nr:EutN/CcmL family microcompartment protein [Planctomycetia bacterium]
MNQAMIIGTATSIAKHVSLTGAKLLVALPVDPDHRKREGDPIIVFDKLGAGVGDVVLISSDGSYTGKEILGTRTTPGRWGVIGIIEQRKKDRNE